MGAPPLTFTTVGWLGDRVVLLDQRRLPADEVYLECRTWHEVAEAIRTLAVRGAPAIGVAAACGAAMAARGTTRPTAVNLFWALERMRRLARKHLGGSVDELRAGLAAEAEEILEEDIASNRRLGAHGARLSAPDARILTHCN